MRFRYAFEDGKHLVRTRDDVGEWIESRSYDSQEDAQAVVSKGEAMAADTIAEVEKALTGPKSTAQAAPKSAPRLPTETEGATRNVPDIDKDDAPPKPTAKPEPAEEVDPHDFTAIPGIGAVTAEKLRENGITTLRMLSRVSASRAEELGIRDDWIAEAKKLSE